uniref:Uncharacterized protein n=1 Tax=Arundo donax TaxID=35708 RepID=A0A0A9DD16_ARUDO
MFLWEFVLSFPLCFIFGLCLLLLAFAWPSFFIRKFLSEEVIILIRLIFTAIVIIMLLQPPLPSFPFFFHFLLVLLPDSFLLIGLSF